MKFMLSLVMVFFSFTFPASALEAPLPKDSLYHLQSGWVDQNNQAFDFKSLLGKPILITMVYTSCPHACPMIISRIQEIQKAIKARGIRDYHIVLASFDTVNDKPAKLKEYMKKRSLDPAQWTLLWAKSDSTARELALVLGISYKDMGDGDFSHSNVITLLDKNGSPLARTESLTASFDDLVKKVPSKGSK